MLHTKEHLYHLSIAYGSLMEVETHLQIAARLSYLQDSSLESLLVKDRGDKSNAEVNRSNLTILNGNLMLTLT